MQQLTITSFDLICSSLHYSPGTIPDYHKFPTTVSEWSHAVPTFSERGSGLEQLSMLPLHESCLLAALCAMGTSVPEILLIRFTEPRMYWRPDGEVGEQFIAVDDLLARSLSDRTHLERNVQSLQAKGLIFAESGSFCGSRNFSVDDETRRSVLAGLRNLGDVRWICQVLICHAFPGIVEEARSVRLTHEMRRS